MTRLPPLLRLDGESAYRDHFRDGYLPPAEIHTFDGIHVRFFDGNFHHAFYCESSRGSGKKDRWSLQRAERMDWIAAVLQDRTAELYRRDMPDRTVRRIALIPSERYTVVIQVNKDQRRANFVTAYVVESDTALRKMRSNPKW